METDLSMFDGRKPFPIHLIALVWLSFIFISLFMVFQAIPEAWGQSGETLFGSNAGDTSDTLTSVDGSEDLDSAVASLARRLVRQGALNGKPVLINAHDLYEARSGLSLPLATQLRGKLITEMKKNGCRVLLPGADTQNAKILQGTWQKQGKDVRIDLKVMKLGRSGPEVVASASEKVPLNKIDQDALSPDRESWARYLVRKMERNSPEPVNRTLHMREFQVKGKKCSDDLGAYLAGWIRPALAESRLFVPLDQQKALSRLSVSSLRTRGTRGIRPEQAPKTGNSSLTADLLKADGELKGSAWLHKEKVEVRILAINRQGQQITAASADVPVGLFPAYLLETPPISQGHGQQSSSGKSPGGISKDGLMVELTTTRGEGRPFYREGEHIKFVIRLNRIAYVYLFDLDSKGNATLLYPVDGSGRLARGGQCGSMPRPNVPIILPEDGCSYDLVVTKPYGTDRVWVVGAESPLDFPGDLAGDWSRADELVRRLRNQGLSGKGGYAEAEVEVVTGP
jgi:hypothetical protein